MSMKSNTALRRGLAALAFAALAALFASCNTVPVSVPEDLSAAEIIQKAQEASDKYNYNAARFYYATTRERFGSDPVVAANCMYELAFISYKQGRHEEARRGFEELLAFYARSENETLPSTFRILAVKVLAKLPPSKNTKPATGAVL